MKHKLSEHETILPDEYPVNYDYVYIADKKFVTCPIRGTVGSWKRQFGINEIRRCDIFGHSGAKLGDEVE